jgi:hypothetical protein
MLDHEPGVGGGVGVGGVGVLGGRGQKSREEWQQHARYSRAYRKIV